MAQFESLKADVKKRGASLIFIAAQKRGGMLDPEKYFQENKISFPFLLDEDRSVTKTYGVYHMLGLDAFNIARPATFVVDRDKVVRFIYVGSSQTDRAPIEDIFKALKTRASTAR